MRLGRALAQYTCRSRFRPECVQLCCVFERDLTTSAWRSQQTRELATETKRAPWPARTQKERSMKPSLYAMAAMTLLTACPAHAQLTVDMSKVTCKQFVTYEITDARSLSIWLSGYFNAQQKNTTVDINAFRKKSNALKDYCLSHFETPLMDAAKTVVDLKP